MVINGILYFAENMGQLNSDCRYILEQSSYKVLFYDNAVEFVLYGHEKDDHIFLNLNLRDTDTYTEQNELFLDAKDKLNITVSYMKGARNQWINNVPVYERLCYHNVCDGIEMEFYIENGSLKQNFIVYSEDNLKDLQLDFSGQQDLYSGKEKKVIIAGYENTFELDTPYDYFYHKLAYTK